MGFRRDAIIDRLNAARIAFGRLSDLEDLQRHPQNRFRQIETEQGLVEALGRGAVMSSDVPVTLRLATLGEHSQKIRAEFDQGLDD